ncbi:MAG TPA: MotA/TolQ/ExbB proton channel family protein [Burkholderiales bacterium]|jgi:biopolymer transport protein ExbB/TolQ|nr:MotA/TolQ/ExbB proton channel family protein [Burkholderiales bacterium]
MIKHFPAEFVYQFFALIFAAILVHGTYVSVVRPNAEAVLAEQRALVAKQPDAEVETSAWVILKDYEQEACFILMLWALAILGYKWATVLRERGLLESDLLPLTEGIKILPEDARRYAKPLDALKPALRNLLLPRAVLQSLTRFETTQSVQDAALAADTLCQNEGERLDSELAQIRYIAWAIPSIGFIGTVRGIGNAMGLAHRAVQGDITGVTQNLGTAFNSTLIALLLSIVLMFLVHQLQLAQERLVLDTESYVNDRLIRHLRTS